VAVTDLSTDLSRSFRSFGVIEVPPNRLYQILAGKRNITADTALRLGQHFGVSPDFWMNLLTALVSRIWKIEHFVSRRC